MELYILDIDENEEDITSVFAVGLVTQPAIERNWMAFVKESFVEPSVGESKDDFLARCIPVLINEGKEQDQAVAVCSSMYDEKFSKFAAIDDEKMILAGPLMAADQPIYRRDGAHEYYVSFPAKSIEKIVTKYGRSGKTLSFNINHNDSSPVKGAFLQQHFIIDSTKGINTPEGFEKLPDGSWFGFVKVDDREFWDSQIKTGNLKGFSVEGYFNDKKLLDAEQAQYEELKNKLLQCLN